MSVDHSAERICDLQETRGLRQHSLLNLARLHYLRHEHVACRKVSVPHILPAP